jgi:hypothetical protein
MADNFLLFSEVTPQLSQEEYAWFHDQLQTVYIVDGEELTDRKGVDEDQVEWTGARAYRDLDEYDPDLAEPVGFEYRSFNSDEDCSLWFFSNEWGFVAGLAHLMQKFLKRFRPAESWSLTYATICSKPRVGEFGGGAVFVTARRILWRDAHSLNVRRRHAFERRNGKFRR